MPELNYPADLENSRVGDWLVSSRINAFHAINTERAYQEAQRGNAKRHEGEPLVMTVGEYIVCMEKCMNDAREAWYKPDGNPAALNFLRKVAGLAVACMEHHGAPERE